MPDFPIVITFSANLPTVRLLKALSAPPFRKPYPLAVHPLPMQYEKLGELPEWVKLVNRLLHGQETLEDVRPSMKAME